MKEERSGQQCEMNVGDIMVRFDFSTCVPEFRRRIPAGLPRAHEQIRQTRSGRRTWFLSCAMRCTTAAEDGQHAKINTNHSSAGGTFVELTSYCQVGASSPGPNPSHTG